MGYEGHLQISTPNFEERKTKAQMALSSVTKSLSALEGARDYTRDSHLRRDRDVQHHSGVSGRDRDSAWLVHLHGQALR